MIINLIKNIVRIHFLDLESVPSQRCQLPTQPSQGNKRTKSQTQGAAFLTSIFWNIITKLGVSGVMEKYHTKQHLK